MLVRLEPAAPQSHVAHSTLSHCAPYYVGYVCHVGYGCLLVFSAYNLLQTWLNQTLAKQNVGPDLDPN